MTDKQDLKNLEQGVDDLIQAVLRLKDENLALRERHDKLLAERNRLAKKTELAQSRIEAMIGRLKTMGQDA